MTVTIQEFIDKTDLPSFLTTNPVFRSFDKVSKVYPKLGLPNCKEDVDLDNAPFVMASAQTLVETFRYIFDGPSGKLSNYRAHYPKKKVSPEKINEIGYWGDIITKLNYGAGGIGSAETIRNNNGKISLKISKDIIDKDGKIVFKHDESLFRIYNKIYQALADLKCGIRIKRLDSMPKFKRFSSDNLPHDRFQIVFASDGIEGLWDIATMSMRGVSSCQSWTGQYKKNLIGSIVDPFVGVIYLTSGTNINKFGTKMVKRSLVRLAINNTTKKPFIIVDRIYPKFDETIKNKFIDFIKARVGEKFEVHYGPSLDYLIYKESYIPVAKAHSKLTKTTRSYRDTKIPFKIETLTETTQLEKNIHSKQTRFRNILRNTSFGNISLCAESLLQLKHKDHELAVTMIESPDFKFLVRDYYRDIASKAICNLEFKNHLTSTEYMRNLCFYYLNNKEDIIRGNKSAFVKKINNYFSENYIFKINYKVISKVLEPIQKEIDKNIKEELKKLLNKKHSSAKLPD